MYRQKLKLTLSIFIAFTTLGLFGWQQFRQLERMTIIRTDNSVETVAINKELPEEEPETVVSEKNLPQPNENPDVNELLERLNVEGPLIEKPYYATATPNDTIYPQWYSTIISAPDAWDTSTGSSDVLVAVIDSGYALGHEDLTDAWHINDGEQGMTQLGDACWSGISEDKQTNDCDDDANGYDDDWRGWDFSNDDNFPQAGDNSVDGSTHGTKVAGLVGARSNNGVGVASVNWNTKIMPLQGLYDEGVGYSSDIAYAILYAVDSGADVINMSLGGPSPDSLILAAVQYANSKNVVVVTSSGNCGDEQESDDCLGYPSPGGMGYPARYSETIAVGATNSSDNIASFSSWGPELDIVAPGSGTIRTTTWSSGNETSAYSTSSFGTSFSSPIVAGMVGVIKAEFPELDKEEVVAILKTSADKVSGMGSSDRTNVYGHGRVNMDNMLDEITEYRRQLLKTGGVRGSGQPTATSNPLVSTDSGHTDATAVTSSNGTITYCVTTANTNCTLSFTKNDNSVTVSLGTSRSNAQGIAEWYWDADDLVGTGIWKVQVNSNTLNSVIERIRTK